MRAVMWRTHNPGVAWNMASPSGHGRIMSSLNSKALQRSRIPGVPDGRPAITSARLVLVIALFAAAFAIDLLSGRQYSQVLGSAAILGSALTLFPAIRPGLIAASACGLTWVTFNVIRAVADDARLRVAGRRTVSHVEHWVFGGSLPSARLQDHLFDPARVQLHDIALALVHASFFVVPYGIAVIAWWWRRALFLRYLRATAICFAFSLVAFILLPTAPPWMSDADDVTRITHHILNRSAGGSASAGSAGPTEAFWFEPNDVAALPSVHVAIAVLVFLTVSSFARWGRPIGALYALAMSVTVVYLGEHFALDVITGWIVAFVAWTLARSQSTSITKDDP